MDDVRLPEFEVDSCEVARAHCRRSAQSGRVEFISGGDRRHNRLMVRAFWKLGCPSRRRTMRACAPALMRSPCSSRRPTVKQQPRARLSKTSGRRPQRRTRAGPSSCSMAPTYVQCPVIRVAISRRSAARWSGKDSPPGASRSCAAWPSSRMPCCVRRCRVRVGGRARRSPRSATATPPCRRWCARPRAGRWSPSWTGSISPCACPCRAGHARPVRPRAASCPA